MGDGFIIRKGGGIDVSDATATAADVKSGETFYAGEEKEIKTGTASVLEGNAVAVPPNVIKMPPNLGPGPTTLIAGDSNAGFFGKTTQTQFGRTMTQVMADLGITQGTAQFTTDDLLKFVHNGKIKYINQRNIRFALGDNFVKHIKARLDASGGSGIHGGRVLTFGGNSYRVRLMRGWGQVSATYFGINPPNYNTGPLKAVSLSTFSGTSGNNGVNWPNNDSPWNAASPNEWNTLIFPIHENSGTQTQTANTPNWASYSNTDLNFGASMGLASFMQETRNPGTGYQLTRGYNFGYTGIASWASYIGYLAGTFGLRLVFELM